MSKAVHSFVFKYNNILVEICHLVELATKYPNDSDVNSKTVIKTIQYKLKYPDLKY